MTRYKLDIPEFLLPILSDTHRAINGNEVKVIQYDGEYCFVNSDNHESYFADAKVFVSWLTEIKEPVSRDDLINGCLDEISNIVDMHGMRSEFWSAVGRLVDKVDQNNELRHQETISSKEAFNHYKTKTNRSAEYGDWFNCWQACKESHNIK